MANRTESLGIRITADANGVNAEIEKVIRNVNKLGATGQTASKNLQRTTQATQSMGNAARAASQALAAFGASFSIVQLGKVADAYANIQARIKLVSGSAAELATANRELFRISQENLSPLQETASMYARIAQSIADMGRSQRDALAVTDLVGKTLRISGASAEEASSAILQFGQALGAGVLQGEELKAILESSPRLAKALADALNVTTGQLKAMGAAGELTSRQVVDALLSQGDKIKREYGQIPTTIGAAFTQLENAFTRYIGSADQGTGASKELAESISLLAKNINLVLDPFAKFVSTTVNGWGKILESVKQVRIALGDLQAYKDQFDVNQALSKEDWMQRRGGPQTSNYTPGGGFGAEETQFFDQVDKSAKKAAESLKGFNEMQRKIYEASIKYKLDPAMMLGLAQRESAFNPKATNPKDGGRGLFQFMPKTWAGVQRQAGKSTNFDDAYDPDKQIDAAMRYMTQVKKIVWNSRGMADLVAAWNYGPERMVRAINKGRSPESVTTKGHVPNVMRNAENWQKRLAAIPEGDLKQVQETGKEIEKYQADQYKSYVEHLKARESAFEDYSKTALAEQRTMMEQLDAAQQKAEQKAKAAMAGGDISAIRAAEEQQKKFIQDKHDLLKQGIAIEEEATKLKIRNIDREIAKAQQYNQYDEVTKKRQEKSSELAELAALAERRKQIEIGAQADISKAATQFEDDRRQAQRQAADDNVRMIEEQRQASEDAYRQMQQVIDLRMTEAANLADARKQDIDNQVEAARAETAAAQASRQASLEGLSGIEAQQKAREILNANLRDTLDLIDLEKTKALEKLVIDGDILASQRQLLEVYKAIADQDGRKADALAIEKQLQDVYAGQAKNIRDRVAAQSKAAAEAAKAQVDNSRKGDSIGGDQVKEEQLRLNAWWDQYMGRLRDYATLWEQITGNTSDGWSQMTLALGEYQKQFNQIQQYWASDAGKSWGDLAPMMEVTQQAQAALAGMAKTLMAMRNQYKEGTQGYKDMTSAAERMMEVQRVLAVVEGVMGVLHQLGSGDPYTAPARAAMAGAIVAAQLAAIGMSAAQVPGFSNKQAREQSQQGGSSAYGGGVFGDTSAKSDSITKSLEIVSQNSTADLAYSAGMYRSLRNIELSLAGTTNAIIRGVGPTPQSGLGTRSLDSMINPLNSISDPITKFLHNLVFNVSKKITNWGISSGPQQLDQVIAKGFQGMNWTEVTKTTKVLGITIGKSVKNFYTALDTGVAGQITRVIISMADSVREAGKAFGISAEQFSKGMANFAVNFGTMSTKGLKGKELQEAVQQVFSSMSDDMAQAFQSRFQLGLEPFMRAGEGMFETLVRVADGINVATGMLEQAGLQAISYQQIVMKQGDVAAEIIRQSIVMFEGIGSAIGAYVDQAVGSAEELMAVYQDLLIVSDTAKLAGFNLNNLSNALIVTSGGVAKFLENLTTYQTEILGSSDYARQVLTLTREFSKLGIAVPSSNEAFVKLVDSIDTSTEAGQKLYAQILSLAGAFSKAQAEAAKLEELRAKYLPTDSLKGYRDQIKQVDDDFRQIIEGSLARLPGGGNYLKRTRKIDVLGNRIEDRQDKLAIISEDIRELEAKGKLTALERQRLATLRAQRKELNTEISAIQKQIADIEKLIAKNPKSKALLEERAKLIEEQGDAVIKTLADIWDSMTQAINNAKETLKSIQDSIFELAGGAGGESIKLGMANARRITAESAYNAYSGNDIARLNTLADAYYKAIMDEYQAKLDMIEAPKKALEKERELRQKAHDKEIDALEKQLGKARELYDAIESIRKYALDLKLGSQSTASPRDMLMESQKQFEDLLKRAQGGDVKALQDITGASSSYLEAAQKYYGSNSQYANIYDGVLKAMEGLGAMDPGDADSIQARIDALNEEHGKYLESIDKQIADLKIDEQIQALQTETAAKLQMLADDLGPRITKAEEQAKKDMQTLIDEAKAGNKLNADQLTALNEMLKGWGMAPVDVPAPEPTLPAPTDSWVQDIYDKWIEDQTGYKPPLPAFAAGGLAGAGWALVGEEGPELVKFGSQAMVYDAEKTKRMLREMASFQPIPSQGGKPINLETMPRVVDDIRKPSSPPAKLYTDDVVAELRALQREVKALVTTQSGANPQLITELQTLNRRMDSIERTQRIKP